MADARRRQRDRRPGRSGPLRIDFAADGPDEGLEPISREEWFEWFDRNDLVFLYRERAPSTLRKLVAPGRAESR